MQNRERFPTLQMSLLWSLLIIVCVASLPLGANRPLSWTMLAFLITLIFFVQIVTDLLQPPPEQLKGLWLPATLFLGALIWGIVQIIPGTPPASWHPVWADAPGATALISADPEQGQHAVMRLFCYAMIFWLALRCCSVSTNAEIMLRGFAVFSTLLAIFGLYALATGDNVILGEGGQGRSLSASFVNRNNYATYAAFGALANIAAYVQFFQSGRINKGQLSSFLRDLLERFFAGAWIFGIGALLCITALALSQSRAGNIAGLAGLIGFAAIWQRRGKRFNPYLWLLLATAIGFVALTNATGLTTRFLAEGAEGGRFLVYPDVIRAIWDRPLLGHGLGSFQDIFRQYLEPELGYGEWIQAHNTYLENAFELGLPAALAFYFALALIGYRIRRGARIRKNNRAFSCFAFACLITAALHSAFDFSLQVPAVAAAFAMILGMGWSQSFSHKTELGKKRLSFLSFGRKVSRSARQSLA